MNSDQSGDFSAAADKIRSTFDGNTDAFAVFGVSAHDSVRIDVRGDQTVKVWINPGVLGFGADSATVERLVSEAVADLIKRQVENFEAATRLLDPSTSAAVSRFTSRSAAFKTQVEEIEQNISRIQARLQEVRVRK